MKHTCFAERRRRPGESRLHTLANATRRGRENGVLGKCDFYFRFSLGRHSRCIWGNRWANCLSMRENCASIWLIKNINNMKQFCSGCLGPQITTKIRLTAMEKNVAVILWFPLLPPSCLQCKLLTSIISVQNKTEQKISFQNVVW